jgi:hypothetical protein
MKLTSLAILAALIMCPFLFIMSQQTRLVREDLKLRDYYDTVVDNAIMDAAQTMTQYSQGLSYSASTDLELSRTMAVQTFFDSLYVAFNAQSDVQKARVEACVPVLLFLQHDGYTLYALHAFKNADGQTQISHGWFPQAHYVGETLLDRYVMRYTLGDTVYAYDRIDQKLYEGTYQELASFIPFFNDARMFENLRLAAVRSSIENSMENYMAQYDQWAFQRSLSISFHFPAIDEADWRRALTDEGMLAFAQGFPVLMGRRYEHYALGGARIIRKEPLMGYSYQSRLWYCRTDCEYFDSVISTDPTFLSDTLIYFTDAYEAAQNGYYPCTHCRP